MFFVSVLSQRVWCRAMCVTLSLMILLHLSTHTSYAGELQPKISVTVVSTEIMQYDPVLIQVEVHNQSKEDMLLLDEIGTMYETLDFDLKDPGEQKYHRIYIEHFGLEKHAFRDLSGSRQPRIFANTIYRCYNILFTGTQPLFSTTGKYALRTRIKLERGKQADLPDVIITVKEIGKPHLANVSVNEKRLGHLFPGWDVSDKFSVKGLSQLQSDLSNSEHKKMVGWWIHIAKIREASDQKDLDKVLAEFRLLQKTKDKITQDFMSIAAVEMLTRKGALGQAQDFLNSMNGQDGSTHRYLQHNLKSASNDKLQKDTGVRVD